MDSNFSLDSLLNVSAVPQDDRVAAFIAESKNNRSRCYEMSEQMTAAVATDGQAFQQYLDVQSRFDRYTANNALLIYGAEAGGAEDWRLWLLEGSGSLCEKAGAQQPHPDYGAGERIRA